MPPVNPKLSTKAVDKAPAKRYLSLDTETTGLDLYHGARPFIVTTCNEEGVNTTWEWEVDPYTRRPLIPQGDLDEIGDLIFGTVGDDGPYLVLQNAKFDVAALRTILPPFQWPWHKTYDTIMSGHILASNYLKDLTNQAMNWLGEDIKPYEDRLKAACQEARRYCRTNLKGVSKLTHDGKVEQVQAWKIANFGMEDMPSVAKTSDKKKDPAWKFDSWLPRALHSKLGVGKPEWLDLCRQYADVDSCVTLALWRVHEKELHDRGLWKIFLEARMRLPGIIEKMERRGVTASKTRTTRLINKHTLVSEAKAAECLKIAEDLGYELDLPKGASNNSLKKFCFEGLQLQVITVGEKSGDPSINKESLCAWEQQLEAENPDAPALRFVRALQSKRKADTAISYMRAYLRFMIPFSGKVKYQDSEAGAGHVLHPSLNPVGSDTLRFTSSNPNEQNIGKGDEHNIRECFGPAPGREWWSFDGQNLELRIPAFKAGEEDLMRVFLYPEEPPYFGSYHLVVFAALHPELFAKHGKACKDLFDATYYQWVKNGNFAVIYGAQKATADRTYHVEGAYDIVMNRFPKIAKLSQEVIAYANKTGQIETFPDRTIDPAKGYPLMCSRTAWGGVSPTVPLNYKIQGTAMQWTCKGMIRVDEQLDYWLRKERFDAFITMQIHDELLVDMPKGRTETSNLWRAKKIAALMAKGGDDIGVPTPVGIKYHPHHWGAGKRF